MNEVSTKTEPLPTICFEPDLLVSKRKNAKPNRRRNTKTKPESALVLKSEIISCTLTNVSKMLVLVTQKAISIPYWTEISRDFWKVFCVGASDKIRIHFCK